MKDTQLSRASRHARGRHRSDSRTATRDTEKPEAHNATHTHRGDETHAESADPAPVTMHRDALMDTARPTPVAALPAALDEGHESKIKDTPHRTESEVNTTATTAPPHSSSSSSVMRTHPAAAVQTETADSHVRPLPSPLLTNAAHEPHRDGAEKSAHTTKNITPTTANTHTPTTTTTTTSSMAAKARSDAIAPVTNVRTPSASRASASPSTRAQSTIGHGVGAPPLSDGFDAVAPSPTHSLTAAAQHGEGEAGVFQTLKMFHYQTPVSSVLGDKLASRYGPYRSPRSQDERSLRQAPLGHTPHDALPAWMTTGATETNHAANTQEDAEQDKEYPRPTRAAANEQSMSTVRDLIRPTFPPLQTLRRDNMSRIDLMSDSAHMSDAAVRRRASGSVPSTGNAPRSRTDGSTDTSTDTDTEGAQEDSQCSNSMYTAHAGARRAASGTLADTHRTPRRSRLAGHTEEGHARTQHVSPGIGRDDTFSALHGTPQSIASLHTSLLKDGASPSQRLGEAMTTPGMRTPQSSRRPTGMRGRMQQLALEESSTTTTTSSSSSDSDAEDSRDSARRHGTHAQHMSQSSHERAAASGERGLLEKRGMGKRSRSMWRCLLARRCRVRCDPCRSSGPRRRLCDMSTKSRRAHRRRRVVAVVRTMIGP